jgi:hypothetical protein
MVMAEMKERRKTPRKTTKTATPQPDSQAEARASAAPDDIRRLIAEAAYYKAKERGFQPGHELEDWVQAESEVMRRVERRT